MVEYQAPLELYKNHELIVIGKVISLTEISKLETIYNIKVEEYLKNPKPYDLIDAYGLGTKNQGVWIEDQTVFEIGDRVLLYLYKEDGKYKISPYSFIAPKSCEKHQLLELPIIPGEPDRGFRPASGPIYLASINENETVTIPSSAVNRLRNNIEIVIKYDAWNNHRTFMDFDVEISITRDNETVPVFHDKHTLYNLEPCSGPLTESWNFTPTETGKYNVTVLFDGITTSYDFVTGENKGSVTFDKTVYPVPFNSSPLKQFKSRGVSIEDIICKPDLVLIGKYKDATPACLKPETAASLIKSGWGRLVITNDYNTTGKDCGTSYQLVYPYDGAEKFKSFNLDFIKFHFSQLDNFKEKFGAGWWKGISISDTIWKGVFLVDFPIIMEDGSDERHYIDEFLYNKFRYMADEYTELRPQYFGIYCNK